MGKKKNVEDISNILKKRWKLILIFILVSILISSIGTFFIIKPEYEASSKLFIGKDETTSKVKSYDNNDVIMYQKLLKTYSEILKTKDLAKSAIKNSSVDIKLEKLLNDLTTVPLADTQILQIKLKSAYPNDANKLLVYIIEEFIDLSRELVPNGNIQILEDVQVSKEPISPNKKMNIVIAFLIGLIGSIGVVVLLEFIDDTFKSKDQMERELEIAVIGVIPSMNEN